MTATAEQATTEITKTTQARLAIAAMQRAIKQLESGLPSDAPKLDAGGYPLSLTVSIAGDVTVAKSTPAGETKRVADIKHEQVLAGIALSLEGDEERNLIGKAVRRVRKVRDGEIAAEKAKSKLEEILTRINAECEKVGLVIDKASPARAGKIEGKPAVMVAGMAGAHRIDVDVEGGAAA
ncbi:MAG: hypothetical protein AAF747_11160 [Planctomycetota bacterium]